MWSLTGVTAHALPCGQLRALPGLLCKGLHKASGKGVSEAVPETCHDVPCLQWSCKAQSIVRQRTRQNCMHWAARLDTDHCLTCTKQPRSQVA